MQAVIDIGNSRVKLAYFEGRELSCLQIFGHDEKEAILQSLSESNPESGILSSTAASDYHLDLPADFAVLHLNQNTPMPLLINYQEGTLGLDRIADAMGAWATQAEESITIDIGTCITYNHVRKNTFIGGSISPGLHMRLEAMHTFTGRLPLVQEVKQVNVIADNTADSLLSGAFHGIRMEIEAQLGAFYSDFPKGQAFMTGGDALLFAKALKNPIFADPILTLKGLNEILLYQKT